jgi:hypothetical protein
MSYFIFLKNSDGVENTFYKIAANEYDLNNLNININDYKIIQDSQENFNAVKYSTKQAISYSGNVITYANLERIFLEKKNLIDYITNYKNEINNFLKINPTHPLFQQWNTYFTQLNNFNVNTITYPLNKSLEQYFNDLGQASLSPLQLP